MWGEISLHAYYIAKQLNKESIQIDFYLYTPNYAYKYKHSRNLFSNFKKSEINIIEIKCTRFEAQLIKLYRITEFLKFPLLIFFSNLLLPNRTSKVFNSNKYKFIITISHLSLYWLFKTEPNSLKKTLHYSLEVFKTTDPGIYRHTWLYAIIKMESKLLLLVKGLIIQDKLRAETLLKRNQLKDLNIIYFPVSIPGNKIRNDSDYLCKMLGFNVDKKIILYFGADYKERKLEELITTFSEIKNQELVLVIHGAGELPHIKKPENVRFSNLLVDYDDIHEIISSATIGIALYDNSWPNTRYTAFSSEKIARYLQSGIPFIALQNESYDNLKNEFNCCELIEDTNELESAINIIMNDYDNYRMHCYDAYEKYYKIENTIKPLVKYLLSDN